MLIFMHLHFHDIFLSHKFLCYNDMKVEDTRGLMLCSFGFVKKALWRDTLDNVYSHTVN